MKISTANVNPSQQNPEAAGSGINSRLASMMTSVSQRPVGREQEVILSGESSTQAVNEKFVQLFDSHEGVGRKDLYEDLDSYLVVPVELSKMDIRERTTVSSGTELTINWAQTSPAFIPSESEKVRCGMQVADQFITDINRVEHIIELPGHGGDKIELDKNMHIDERISTILIGVFGEHHIKQISEIATQAHMAEFTAVALSMGKNDYIVVAGDSNPQCIIKKQEDGTYTITSSKIFRIRNVDDEKIIEGLTIAATRTNTLLPDRNDSTQLVSGAKEEKDGIHFQIQYVKSDTPGIAKKEPNLWQKLKNVFSF